MSVLATADMTRCQVEKYAWNAFAMGRPVFGQRCDRTPGFIAEEIRPADDGLSGSMSLCPDCASHFLKSSVARRCQISAVAR